MENVVAVLAEHRARAADPIHDVRSCRIDWAVLELLRGRTTEGVGMRHRRPSMSMIEARERISHSMPSISNTS